MSETRERSALEVLRRVEWVQDEYGGWCPICDMEEDQGHAPDCALDAVLRATPASDGGEVRERALNIVDFLHGAGPLDGRWFHERPGVAGPYWWRRYLEEIRAALLRTPSGEGEARVRVPEAMDRGCDCSGCYCGNSGDAESVGYADGWNACRAEMLAARTTGEER